jgi:WD40 repeat protein
MDFTADGSKAIVVEEGGRARLWDLATARSESFADTADTLEGNELAVDSQGRTLAVWHGLATAIAEEEETRQSQPKKTGASPKARLNLVSRNNVQLWDLETRQLRTKLGSHKYAVRAGAFSPDGRTFATGSEDGTIKLWDAASGVETCTLKGHTGGVLTLAFSHDGTVLTSGSRDGTVRIWRAPRIAETPRAASKKAEKAP